jgi:hypothetical protein
MLATSQSARMTRCWIFLLVASVLVLTCPVITLAQRSDDSQLQRLLQVRRRQVELKALRAELTRSEELASRGLASQAEVQTAQVDVEKALIGYQEALLELLDVQPIITVQRAVKIEEADGRKVVNLTVKNLSPTIDDSQIKLLNSFDGIDPVPRELLNNGALHDVFISLKDTGGDEGSMRGTTVALPYEMHVARMQYGESKTMRFSLLKDVQRLVVSINCRGEMREIDVQLQQAETERLISVEVTELSQEADLGSQVSFDLTLERPSVGTDAFHLLALNLPQQITYSFIDPTTQARLSQIQFSAGVTRKQLKLTLFLPERADEKVVVDAPIEFYAVAVTDAQRARFQDGSRRYTAEEIRTSQIGAGRMEVTPRGIGKIEVSAPSLFSEVEAGAVVSSYVTIKNTGTRRLDNVRLWTEQPQGWRTQIEPEGIPGLEKDREQQVKLTIIPAEQADIGDYEVRIKTESYAYNRRVPSEDKIYRVSIKGRTNLLSTLAVIALLLGVLTTIVVAGVKLMRR